MRIQKTLGRASEVYNQLRACRLVPVVKMPSVDCAEPLAEALLAAGLNCIEVTFRSDAALPAIAKLSQISGLLVGAGTVRTVEQARNAQAAGAAFIVSPATREPVVEYALSEDLGVCPGVCTPSEVERALDLGASVLKFFPAGAYGGVRTLQALGSVYPDVPFFPTGGINLENLADYLRQGNVLCCGGTWLAPPDVLAKKGFEQVEANARQALAVVAASSP